jgi:DNA helicase-4
MDTYIEDYFSKELVNDSKQIQIFLEFIGYYFHIPMELKADGTLGEKIESEHNVDLEPLDKKYKKLIEGEKKTIKGERVKSLEELIIANFLFLNGVQYEYEKEYPFQTDTLKKRYRPDFYLINYDIYLEHFGIDKNNRCPWLSEIEEKKYIEGIEWKRETHETHNTKLIETYSYFQNEGKLLENLKDILLSNNVELKPIPNEELLKLVNEIQSENTIREFRKLCGTFIKLFKSNGYDEAHFQTLKNQFSTKSPNRNYINQFVMVRTQHFLNIVEKVFLYYQSRLADNRAIDFSDMINIAAKQVRAHGINTKYKYIIIDEYQDIGMV